MLEYMVAKKNSRHSLTSSAERRPAAGDVAGLDAGPVASPVILLCTLAERLVCRWVSLNSLITLALEPLGPFFCGIALYVHDSCADEQFLHGLMPSHLTLRRWQASQARFMACDIVIRWDGRRGWV